MKGNKLVLAAFLAYGMICGPVATAQIFTAMGTASDGSPDNAQADFVFNGSFTALSVTLTNTAGPDQLSHIASVLDGIAFHIKGRPLSVLALTSLSDPHGTETCSSGHGAGAGTCVAHTAPVSLATSQWGFNSSTGLLAAGNGSFKPYGILNNNVQALDGITNARHNPYLMGPVTFNFSIFNPSDVPIHVIAAKFYFGTAPDVQTGNTLSPVPEPETYGMLLAGLGLLGFVARRRTQRPVTA